MIVDTTKLTFDTDDGRTNSSPSLVVTADGRKIVFYEKYFTSGLTGYTTPGNHITPTLPLTLNVPAGSGMVNGAPISWAADTEVLPINSFVLVSVDSSNVIHYDTSWTMTDVASSVVLAYVNVGNSSIVNVEEVEKTGRGIYVRKQEASGLNWVWTDEEYQVSTGQEPRAFYDSALNKVFLSYKKDSVVYLRVFDLTTDLTFRYLPNTQISVGVINLNHNPDVSLTMQTAAGSKAVGDVVDSELYPMSVSGLSFVKVGPNYEPHIYLPHITSNPNFPYLVYPYYVEVCSKSGSVYTVEASVEFDANGAFSSERWYQWTGSLGIKYLRIRAQCPDLIRGDVVTPVASYVQVEIWDPFEKRATAGDVISSQIIADRLELSPSAGLKSILTKTYEYEETRDLESDTLWATSAAGMKTVMSKVYEYEETRDFENDTLGAASAAGMKSILVITNT